MGYLDACRTFRNQDTVKKEDGAKEDGAVKGIAKTMKNFVDSSSDNYDDVFYAACGKLCDKYKMKFGQAQKIINMAFKYLFCIAEKETIKERFNKCHMPLDGIMLEWIHRYITDDDGKKIEIIDAWSKMDEGDENKPCTYRYYKKYIDKYCEKNEITPLQLDFENWSRMSQIIAAENYKKTFTEDELENEAHIVLLKEKL